MKKVISIFLLMVLLIFSSTVFAEIPQLINFQGVLKDSANIPQTGTFSMTFSVYDDPTSGSILWTETQGSVLVNRGLFNVLLGSVSPIPYSVFNGEVRWLQVAVNGVDLSPRRKIVSVAYAYKSSWADSAIYADSAAYADTSAYALISYLSYYSYYADTAGMVDGLDPGELVDTSSDFGRWGVSPTLYEGLTPLSSKYLGINATAYNSDRLDGYHAGTSSGMVPINNGTRCVNLNTDLLDGFHASDFTTQTSDFGRSGVSSNLYEGTTSLSSKYLKLVAQTNLNMNNYSINNAKSLNANFPTGNAIYGESNSSGVTAIKAKNSTGNALWAENNSSSYVALYARNPQSNAIKGENNSTSYPAIWGLNPSGSALTAEGNSSSRYAASVVNNYSTTAPGLYVRGTIVATGTKSAVVSTSEGKELLFAIESPDVEFYANGKARLSGGEASILFERLFSESISETSPIKVIVTPVGSWSGIYVTEVNSSGFKVRSETGDLNCEFNWIAIGIRKNFEQRPVLTPELLKAMEKTIPLEQIPVGSSGAGGNTD